jgi:glutaredoxin 2
MKLYHYVHCPFCLRVRFALGFLNLEYESIVLPYDDEKTPIALTGTKMLPIFEFTKNQYINESLEIIKMIDIRESLNKNHYSLHKIEIDHLLSSIGKNVHSLCMPYWVWTPEFNEKSRVYFTNKKELSKGPFALLIKNKTIYLVELEKILLDLENQIKPFYKSNSLTLTDILIASHLWGMYIFPEFQFSTTVHQYLQNVKNLCHFNYHQDYFKN